MQRRRGLALAAAVVAVVSGCTSSDNPSASASASEAVGAASGKPGIQRCATADLDITLGPGEGAAGSTFYAVRLKNTSGHPCRTGGYGRAALASGDPGRLVGRPADRVQKAAARRFVLQDGKSAEATLQESNADNYPVKQCRPTSARGLRVSPPDDTASVFLAHSTTACQSERVHQLRLTPYQKVG